MTRPYGAEVKRKAPELPSRTFPLLRGQADPPRIGARLLELVGGMSFTHSLVSATAIPVTRSSKALRLLAMGAAKVKVGLQALAFALYPLRLDPPPPGIDFTDLICARRALHVPALVYPPPGADA